MARITLTRREALAAFAANVVVGSARADATAMTLSLGTYSLKGLPLADAIALVADTGYDGIELATMPGLAADPTKLSPDVRRETAKRVADRGLKLTALMESLSPSADAAKHTADTARVRRAMELARDLNAASPPLLQTILGGGGTWAEKRTLFRDRLADWLAVANELRVTLCVKPHRNGAFWKPAEAVWLCEQLGKPARLRMVYDYSHYAFVDGLTLDGTIAESLPILGHVAVKDPVKQGDRIAFVLPGEGGTVDYPKLLGLLHAGGYRGDVCCEVSAMVFNKPGYDATAAAKTCYANLAKAFVAAGVARAKRSG